VQATLIYDIRRDLRALEDYEFPDYGKFGNSTAAIV